MDLSVCIASKGEPGLLWGTIHSCKMALDKTDLDYEICLCVNGELDINRREQKNKPFLISSTRLINPDIERILHFLHKSGRSGKCTVLQRSVSPPIGRKIAARQAKGEVLFFLDNHCLVEQDYFTRALQTMQRNDVDLLHSTTKFFDGEADSYEYILTLEDNFWAYSIDQPKLTIPYPCAAGGHGGFAVRSSVWKEIDGYWDGFKGYGGEEITTDVQLWMRGYNVYIDPKLVHYHWAGKRPYTRHYTADYFRNMMMSANILGGEKWLTKVFESFNKTYPDPKITMYELMTQAYYQSEQYSRYVRNKSLWTLDEQLEYFKRNDIAH